MQIMFSLKRDIMAKAYHFHYTKVREIIYNLMPIKMTVLAKEKRRVSKKRIILKKTMLMHFHSELSVLTDHVLNALS